MTINDPNTNLIEAMKEKLPAKGKLADMLMDTLYIGKEAVYRRLRGEVPFTLQEAALVSRKLGISLDKNYRNQLQIECNVRHKYRRL